MTIPKENISSANLEEIRRIIVKLDDQELSYLKSIISDKVHFSREIAKVLPASFIHSQKNGDEINMALVPVIEQVLVESIASRPNIISDALSPIIGKTIRKAINAEFKKLIQNFNLLFENTLSIKGLKWRYQSIVTGKPYSEIVILNTLGFQVQHVLLIHKKTGLLLNEVHASEDLLKDPNLISGMLRAIMDFVQDSMQTGTDNSLETIEIGDNQVWIETGNEVILACVIKGYPPNDYREKMIDLLDKIQQKFSLQLRNFEGDTAPFTLTKSFLKKCLSSSEQTVNPKNQKLPLPFKLFIYALLLLALFFGVKSIIGNIRWNNYKDALQSTEGIFLTHSNKKWKNLEIKGMRTFGSPSPNEIANEYKIDSIRLTSNWQFIMPANNLTLENYVKSKFDFPETMELYVDKNNIFLTGLAGKELVTEIGDFIQSNLKGFNLKTNELKIITLEDLDALISNIKSVKLFYKIGTDTLTEVSQHELEDFINATLDLHNYSHALEKDMTIIITGHSDNSGEENFNKVISLERAIKIGNIFIENRFERDLLQIEGKGSEITRTEDVPAREKRRVEIEINVEND